MRDVAWRRHGSYVTRAFHDFHHQRKDTYNNFDHNIALATELGIQARHFPKLMLPQMPANPRKKLARPQAPGSGTFSNPEPPTYTDLPRLAFMPLVPSAPFFDASAAFST